MSHNPTQDIANHLDTNTTSVTLGTNLFYGIVRALSTDCPAQSVFVIASGGRTPDRVFGTGTETRYADVQVRVRSDGITAGESLARTVYETLQSATPSTGNAYLDVRAQQAYPIFLMQDDRGLYHWVVNFTAVYNST